MQALITGGMGWLGQNLVQCLLKDPDKTDVPNLIQEVSNVRCLTLPGQDTAQAKESHPDIDVVEGDIRNPDDCKRFMAETEDAVLFHIAGIIHPRKVRDFYEINVEGTRNLLNAAAEANFRRAVIMSSNSPCGCNPRRDHLFDESSPYNPYMNYGKSKMQMELMVKEFQVAGSIETVLIRSPWFYGPFQPPRQLTFFNMIKDGKAPIVGGGENMRSMAYVDNICQGLILAAVTERANGEIYWIADEHPYSMNEVVDTVERLLETEFDIVCAHNRLRLPGIVSEMALVIDKLIQATGLYHQKFHVLSEMNKTIACSISKAKEDLGYRPHIDLEEGMRRSLQWLRNTNGQI
ncbi:NAD-dependent epimerase/dehydratase family protein [Candidatus Neomarinimicrobiota bacterium]